MINIFSDCTLVPSELDIIYDAEEWFKYHLEASGGEAFNNDISNRILHRIEGATKRKGNEIITKYGKTHIKDISTGCKAVLLALNFPNYCVSNIEMGDNAMIALFREFKSNANILVYNCIEIDDPSKTLHIKLDGEVTSLFAAVIKILEKFE